MNWIRHHAAVVVFLATFAAVLATAGWLEQRASSRPLDNGLLQSAQYSGPGVLAPTVYSFGSAYTLETAYVAPRHPRHRYTARRYPPRRRTVVRTRSKRKQYELIGGSAAGGALIGGLAGGGKGAAIGALAGGAGGYVYNRKTRKKRVPAESARR